MLVTILLGWPAAGLGHDFLDEPETAALCSPGQLDCCSDFNHLKSSGCRLPRLRQEGVGGQGAAYALHRQPVQHCGGDCLRLRPSPSCREPLQLPAQDLLQKCSCTMLSSPGPLLTLHR